MKIEKEKTRNSMKLIEVSISDSERIKERL
jgi:hypothetical protein